MKDINTLSIGDSVIAFENSAIITEVGVDEEDALIYYVAWKSDVDGRYFDYIYPSEISSFEDSLINND